MSVRGRKAAKSQQAEEAHRTSEARLAGIVNSAMDAIITVDEEQRILLFNAAAEKMFRCAASEAIGQPLDLFIPQRFRTQHSAHIRSFGRTGVTTRTMAGARSVYGLRADGEEFPVEASISQVEAGEHKLYTVIMRDITERRRAEEEAARLTAEIESQRQRLNKIIATAPGVVWNAIVNQGVLDEGANFIQQPFSPDTLARKSSRGIG